MQIPQSYRSLDREELAAAEQPAKEIAKADERAKDMLAEFAKHPERYKSALKFAGEFILDTYPKMVDQDDQEKRKADLEMLRQFVAGVLYNGVPIPSDTKKPPGFWQNVFKNMFSSEHVNTTKPETRDLVLIMLSLSHPKKNPDGRKINRHEVRNYIRNCEELLCQIYTVAKQREL